jgi:radical SAM superfamily enzyme with C-terminal helix-hairpin-helix motif
MAARVSFIYLAFSMAILSAEQSDEAVFQTVCGACHSYTLISDLKSVPEWKETVDNMIEQGAKADPAERAAILGHLSRNFTRININTASQEEIAEVLDVQASAAQKLIDRRPYRSMEELLRKATSGLIAQLKARQDRITFK